MEPLLLKHETGEFLIKPDSVRSWFTEIYKNALTTIREKLTPRGIEIFEVESGYGGIALTLKVIGFGNESEFIHMDFVLAFTFPFHLMKKTLMPKTFEVINNVLENPKWLEVQSIPFQRELKKVITKGDAYFVSVLLKIDRFKPSTWRWNWKVEFLKAESQILAMNEPVKKMIRLLKYFRNKNSNKGWTNNLGELKSYQLKCVVFNMFKDNPEIRLWCDDNLAKNFVACLKLLQKSLDQGKLSNFFFLETNVLDDISGRYESEAHYLKQVIKELEKSFNMEEEKCQKIWQKYFGETAVLSDAFSKLSVSGAPHHQEGRGLGPNTTYADLLYGSFS